MSRGSRLEEAFARWSSAHRELTQAESKLAAAWTAHAQGRTGVPIQLIAEVGALRQRSEALLEEALERLPSADCRVERGDVRRVA